MNKKQESKIVRKVFRGFLVMKKAITILTGLFLFLCIVGTGNAVPREVQVSHVLGSSNTSIMAPVSNLIDNNIETYWETNTQSTDFAWTELHLSETALIEGIQIYGLYSGELTIEYWQEDSWQSFISAQNIKSNESSGEWHLIDLSYDRIATGRLRLWFSNPEQFMKLGPVCEIKVIGRFLQDLIYKLDPVTLTYDEYFNKQDKCSQKENPSKYLFDNNTYTDWQFNRNNSHKTAEAIADFDEICSIEMIKLFGSNPDKEADNGKYYSSASTVKIQYELDNEWLIIPGMDNIFLNQLEAAWKSFKLTNNSIETSKIRILITGYDKEGLKEVEIWGRKSLAPASRYLYSGVYPVTLTEAEPANFAFDFDINTSSKESALIHVAGKEEKGISSGGELALTWELNGRFMGDLIFPSKCNGFSIFHQQVDKKYLWDGINFVRIYGSDFTIHKCQIELTKTQQYKLSHNQLTDRCLLTAVSGEGEEEIIDLGGTYDLNSLFLRYLGTLPWVEIAVERNGLWEEWANLPQYETGAIGGEIIYSDIGAVGRLKVRFTKQDDGLTELWFNGSLIKDGPPEVDIISPLDGDYIDISKIGLTKLQGTVDNPDVKLKINGKRFNLSGAYFREKRLKKDYKSRSVSV
ncbi:hypothetical protein ES705_16180 [subsurface metagenome]